MCGIGGFVLNKNKSFSEDYIDILKMSSKQKTRGPDNEGLWLEKVKNISIS